MEVSQPNKTPVYHREPVVPVAQPVKKPPVKNPVTRVNREQSNKNKVNFNGGQAEDEKKREKYLTAKYGAHQMALIRKRLKVEMWIFDNLQELYETEVSVLGGIHISSLSYVTLIKNISLVFVNGLEYATQKVLILILKKVGAFEFNIYFGVKFKSNIFNYFLCNSFNL